MPTFMVQTEKGSAVAWELWRLAKATGTRPCVLMGRTLSSRDALAFDLTVMRAHDVHRRMRLGLAVQQSSDGLGAALQRIYEDD